MLRKTDCNTWDLPADDAIPAMKTYKAHNKNDELGKVPLYVIARKKYPANTAKEAKNVVLYISLKEKKKFFCNF